MDTGKLLTRELHHHDPDLFKIRCFLLAQNLAASVAASPPDGDCIKDVVLMIKTWQSLTSTSLKRTARGILVDAIDECMQQERQERRPPRLR